MYKVKSILILILLAFTFLLSQTQDEKKATKKEAVAPKKTKKQTVRDKLIDSSYIPKHYSNESEKKFFEIMELAKKEKWNQLPIGDRIASVGLQLIDVPYVGGTLEGEKEKCSVFLDKLDCVTFFETSLAIARLMKWDNMKFNDLINQVTYSRYRNGSVNGYTSRLHYTSDWITENTKKNLVRDITKEIGGIIAPIKVGFMSDNPNFYAALKKDAKLIKTIKQQEEAINKRQYFYIPKEKIKSIEQKLKSGDIIAIATSMKGLDYSHTGLVYVDKDKKVRFLHASTTKKKVVLDVELSEYIQSVKTNIGITVLRPL